MEGGAEEDNFEDYQETTIDIGQTIPLVTVAALSFIFFLPVFILSVRSSSKKGNGDDNDDEDDETSIIQKIWATKFNNEEESNPLLSTPEETAGVAISSSLEYGGIEPSLSSSINANQKRSNSRARQHSSSPTKRKRHSSVAFRQFTVDARQRQPVSVHIDPSIAVSPTKEDIYHLKSTSSSTIFGREDDNNNDDDDYEKEEDFKTKRFSDPNTTAFEKFLIITCHNCDTQTKGMLKLALPYLTQAFISALSEMIQVAVVGHQLGSSNLSIYIIIDLFIKLTTDSVGNIIMSGNTMIAQIAESDLEKGPHKIGKYLQLSIIFYVIGFLPLLIFWSFFTKDVLLFLGYDVSISELGQQFAIPFTFSILIEGVAAGFQYMLDVVGFEVQSTILTFFGELGTTSTVVVVMCWHRAFPDMNLVDLGYLYLFVDLLYFATILFTIFSYGWLEEYYEGLFSFFKKSSGNDNKISGITNSSGDMAAIKLMLYNAMVASFSNFLFQGEWQVMIFYASTLGPAEVAAWGLLGVIWEQLEYIVTAVANGCEVRCTLSLGTGDIQTAKLIAYRSLWVCFVWGAIVSAIFGVFGAEIPKFLTSDPVLQKMVSDNLPLISLANLLSGVAIMAEHLLWGQNRVTLGAGIGCLTTAFVALPLGALSSIVYNYDLKGMTASVTIGGSAFAALSMFSLISSDWKKITEDIMSLHGHSSCSDSPKSVKSLEVHKCDCNELPTEKMNAAETLEYNEKFGNNGVETQCSHQEWKDLTSR